MQLGPKSFWLEEKAKLTHARVVQEEAQYVIDKRAQDEREEQDRMKVFTLAGAAELAAKREFKAYRHPLSIAERKARFFECLKQRREEDIQAQIMKSRSRRTNK